MTKDQQVATYIIDRYASHMMIGNYCIDKSKLAKVRPASRLLLGYMMTKNSTIGTVDGKPVFVVDVNDDFKSKFITQFGKNERAFKTSMNELVRLGVVEIDEGTKLHNISSKCFNINDIDPQYIKFNDVLEMVLF
jgi:hypothetical protein